MVNEELEKQMHAEVANFITTRLNSVQNELVRLQGQINEAFTRALERLASAGEGEDGPLFVALAEHLRAAYRRGIEDAANESAHAKAASDVAALKAAVEEFNNRRTQAEVLTALVNRAASFAPRVLFFVVKGGRLVGWRARGLEGTVGDASVREIALTPEPGTSLGEVVESGKTWSGQPDESFTDKRFFAHLGGERPQWAVAVPMIARGKTVAVLYADSAALGPEAVNLEALELLTRVASMAVELLAPRAAKVSAPLPERQAVEDAPQAVTTSVQHAAPSAPPAASTEALHEAPSAPQAAPAHVPSEAPAVASAPTAHEEQVTPPQPAAVEPIAGPASNGGPSVAPSSAQTSTLSGYTAPLGSRAFRGATIDLPIEVQGEEERRLHTDARRFARLLVSEIKLYNEQKVREGRERGDLYTRLREEIERSRQMYEKRVAPPVAARFDYFHYELVNTLAEGDPAKLGPNYPGAAVPDQN